MTRFKVEELLSIGFSLYNYYNNANLSFYHIIIYQFVNVNNSINKLIYNEINQSIT